MSVLDRLAICDPRKQLRRSELLKPKPTITISDDGQVPSPLRRQLGIMNQGPTPTIRHFGLDGSSTPPPSKRSTSPNARLAESLSPDESRVAVWDKTTLLEISDSVRESIRNERTFGPDAERLRSFLETVSKDEESKKPTLYFDTIEYAHLDKLITEIVQFAEVMRDLTPTADHLLRSRFEISQSKSLQRAWRRRFAEQFFTIDKHRRAVLVKGGRLKDVSFNNSLPHDFGKWQTKINDPISELESSLDFEPGNWWLNITCAERDGIVASSLQKATKGRYGITALPLLTGQEELTSTNATKYILKGKSSDMHIALISQVGRQIRILRGYRLKSTLAPEAGVRYDGLFSIQQYGYKLDDKTDTYSLEMTIERVAGQRSFDEVKRIPRPSQLDDWDLYEKLEGDKIKLLRGEIGYLEWKLQRQEERIDRDDWRRAHLCKHDMLESREGEGKGKGKLHHAG